MTSPSPEAQEKADKWFADYVDWHTSDPEGKMASERVERMKLTMALALDAFAQEPAEEARREERENCAKAVEAMAPTPCPFNLPGDHRRAPDPRLPCPTCNADSNMEGGMCVKMRDVDDMAKAIRARTGGDHG